MHLFFIRHGETEHNVAGLLAGVSDSRLTNHGVLQTQRLGAHLTTHRNLRFTHLYASDLQRAYMTAEELQRNQQLVYPPEQVPVVVKLDLLREQDFGSLELIPWTSRRAQAPNLADPTFRPQETSVAMTARAELFLADFILPLCATADDSQTFSNECVAVVSHGLFLSILWQTLLRKFSAGTVTPSSNVDVFSAGRSLDYLPSWTNTGFLELKIEKQTVETTAPNSEFAEQNQNSLALGEYSMIIHEVNGKAHLQDLKRARGGIGSAPYDAKQQSLHGFFQRQN